MAAGEVGRKPVIPRKNRQGVRRQDSASDSFSGSGAQHGLGLSLEIIESLGDFRYGFLPKLLNEW